MSLIWQIISKVIAILKSARQLLHTIFLFWKKSTAYIFYYTKQTLYTFFCQNFFPRMGNKYFLKYFIKHAIWQLTCIITNLTHTIGLVDFYMLLTTWPQTWINKWKVIAILPFPLPTVQSKIKFYSSSKYFCIHNW